MNNKNKLDNIFNPHRIALIGVTINPNSVGGKVLTNLVGSGFKGVIYPVNPDAEAVMGISCFKDLESLPKTPELAVICSPAAQVPGWIKKCGEAGIFGIIIMSAGFKEIGEEGKKLEYQIIDEMKKFEDMRIIGPNCLGIIVPALNLNVSFAPGIPKQGNIAFISQSGALCTSVLDWAIEEKIGFSNFVSIGNAIDVDFGDLIDYFDDDEKTKSILLYIESIKNARNFMTAARSFARTKPIVAYKAGRFPESAQVAASHTGAMAAEDNIYDAAFKRMGVARVFEIGEIFDCAELIGHNKIPKGSRLAIVTNAGGPGVMAVDALIAGDGELSKFSEETYKKLNENLPPYWSHGNPVDVLGDAPAKRLAKAVEIVVADKNVDAVLVILTPQAMTKPTSAAKSITLIAEQSIKPIIAAWLGGGKMKEGIKILNEAGIATYSTPEQGVKAFMTLVNYAHNLETLYETPRDIPVEFSIDRKKIRDEFYLIAKNNGSTLTEDISKKLLMDYGIPATLSVPAYSADEAALIASKTGYPVVVKVLSKEISHKSDAGGVILNVQNEAMVRNAFEQIFKNAELKMPGAKADGVTIQRMVTANETVEMIMGIKQDPVFGSVVMAGMGGITAELFKDSAIGFPPLNERLAFRMLESLKIWPLLRGYRGRKPVNVDKLIEILIRLSYLCADFPEIKELDINPLLVTDKEVIALDARVVIDKEQFNTKSFPYAHLAIKPYPEEYVRQIQLLDTTNITLRPIKPEDEPLWLELLASCSKESIYSRFRYFFHWNTHEVAAKFCYIDYDRELAIVAELEEDGKKKLLGVGRLAADPEHETVEYAVLVSDAWQNKDLGSILTDYCFEVAERWGLKKIVAQTTTDNSRMISVFRKRGFEIKTDVQSEMVEVEKEL
jgi:acetyltransferase